MSTLALEQLRDPYLTYFGLGIISRNFQNQISGPTHVVQVREKEKNGPQAHKCRSDSNDVPAHSRESFSPYKTQNVSQS